MNPWMTPAIVAVALMTAPAMAMDTTTTRRVEQAIDQQERNMAEVDRLLDQLAARVGGAKYLRAWDDAGIPQKLDGVVGAVERAGAPADHGRFLALKKRVAAARQRLGDIAASAQPALAAYAKLTDMAGYPEFEADLERTQEIARMYNVPRNAFDHPGGLREEVEQVRKVAELVNANAKTYAPLMNAKTSEGLRFEAAQKGAVERVVAFVGLQKAFVEAAPGTIGGHHGRARAMIAKAEAERSPAFIQGGAQQAIDEAAEVLAVFAVAAGADDPRVAELTAAHALLVKDAARAKSAMLEAILAAVRAPADAYAGGDKASLKAAVEKAWRAAYPEDKILAVRAHRADWTRKSGLRWDQGSQRWERYDHQNIALLVVVQRDAQIATLYPAFVNRDNLARSENVGVATKVGDYVVQDMLVANFK